jgi:hypothetical protein
MTELNAKPNRLETISTVTLWALTSVLAFLLIPTLLDLILKIYAAFWSDYGFYGETYQISVAVRQFLTLPLGLMAVGVIIGGAEYHYRHVGEPTSWKILSETLAVELTFFLISAFI